MWGVHHHSWVLVLTKWFLGLFPGFCTGKSSNTLTMKMVTTTVHQLVFCIRSESDASFLVSFYKCFTDSLLVIGGRFNLPPEYCYCIVDATKHQLQVLVDKRKGRSIRPEGSGEVDGLVKRMLVYMNSSKSLCYRRWRGYCLSFWMGISTEDCDFKCQGFGFKGLGWWWWW